MTQPFSADLTRSTTMRVGCVSYLNAKPLIDRLDQDADVAVRFDVPAKLLAHLQADRVEVALCPVIDFYQSQVPLQIVPVGGISCAGSTLTVRLYSQVPLDRLTTVHVDTDSHTSVALLQVLMHHRHGRPVQLVRHDAQQGASSQTPGPPALLLIGDKVVTDPPDSAGYPHQLDLGQAWWDMTGQPFVFAVWMAQQDADVSALAHRLATLRHTNAQRLEAIAQHYAQPHGWPMELAKHYLGTVLHYHIGQRERQAIDHFAQQCDQLGLIDPVRQARLS